MPYIPQEDRPQYEDDVRSLRQKLEGKPVGHINYVFSRIIWHLFNKKCRYTQGNSLLGMLLCVGLEFYRRKLAKYEDDAIRKNGDLPEA